MPAVSVAGGSIGGLTAALVLRDAGCDVRVFERSSAVLQARGAGIAALEATLRYLVERGGCQPRDVCSDTGWTRFPNRGDSGTLAAGESAEADLLVCEDGVSSMARARLLP